MWLLGVNISINYANTLSTLSAWLLHSAVESSATGQNENILIILRLNQTEVLEDYVNSLST